MVDPLRLEIAALPTTASFINMNMLREHCHVDDVADPATDDLLELYLNAGILWAEGEMHRTIVSRTHRWVLRSFPYDADQEIRLPRGKTQSVENIQYSNGGSITTITGPSASPPGTSFAQDLSGDDGGIVMPPYAGSWPGSDLNVAAPVTINFTAGWSSITVPADIVHALMFYVSDAFELRGTADIDGGRFADLRESKISGYRLHRWYEPTTTPGMNW